MTARDKIPTSEKAAVQGTAAFSKFMRVLQIVSDSDEPLTTALVVKRAGMPRPTVHRIVAALVSEGMLAETEGGQLALGARLISLALRGWDRSDLRRVARAPLERLRDRLDETLHLAVNGGDEMIYIEKLESLRAVSMRSRIGTRIPLYSSAVGKAWLASLPEAEAEAIARGLAYAARTEHTITDPDTLLARLAQIRARGFALDLEEVELEICCYGVAIVPEGERAIGCISVSIPKYRFEAMPAAQVVGAMKDCAREIARQAGGAR